MTDITDEPLSREIKPMISFLCGEISLRKNGFDTWFGEEIPGKPGRFWWRSQIRTWPYKIATLEAELAEAQKRIEELSRIEMCVQLKAENAQLREQLAERPNLSAGLGAKETEMAIEVEVTEQQIDKMVDRFLSWKLPENFCPDAGISFKAEYNENTPYPMKHEPVGTNLFDAEQAREMIKYILGSA